MLYYIVLWYTLLCSTVRCYVMLLYIYMYVYIYIYICYMYVQRSDSLEPFVGWLHEAPVQDLVNAKACWAWNYGFRVHNSVQAVLDKTCHAMQNSTITTCKKPWHSLTSGTSIYQYMT